MPRLTLRRIGSTLGPAKLHALERFFGPVFTFETVLLLKVRQHQSLVGAQVIACSTSIEGNILQQEIKQVVRKTMMDAIIVPKRSVNSAMRLCPGHQLYQYET